MLNLREDTNCKLQVVLPFYNILNVQIYVVCRGKPLKFIVVVLFGISIVVVIWISFPNPTCNFAEILRKITGFFKCFIIHFTITQVFVKYDINIFGYIQISFIVSSSHVTGGITNLYIIINTSISFTLQLFLVWLKM